MGFLRFCTRNLWTSLLEISVSYQTQNSKTKKRRLRMIVTSFQDLKLLAKQISPAFSHFLINNALLYYFLTKWLAHNKKMTEKSVFHEVSSPEMTLDSCFWSRDFVAHRKWNFMFLVRQNTGRENCYQIIFLLYLWVHWGHFIKQRKKICHRHFKMIITIL